MDYNGFKFLALRPLDGTSPDLLKSLEVNCIYRLYNEYSYTLADDKSIKSIIYNPTVPSNLYGKDINVSAIVGQNGSGKSALMELFYYATLICNQKHLNKGDENILKDKVNLEIILQNHNEIIQILKISNENINAKNYLRIIDGLNIVYNVDKDQNIGYDGFDFYTNVLNYSIYGLNANSIPWVDLIFHKNDSYQLPIVINPFKEYGNFDINREYILMQSRAVFYTYVLGLKEIIKNIYIHNIYFEIDVLKILKIENPNKTTFKVLEIFFDISITEEEYNQLLFRDNYDKLISIQKIGSYFNIKTNDKNNESIFKNNVQNTDFYKALTYLYIFKKLYKISKSYKKYKKYHFLFYRTLSFDLHFKNSSEAILNNINVNSEIANDVRNRINKEIVYENIVLNLELSLGANEHSLSEDDLIFIKQEFMSFYALDNSEHNEIRKHLSNLVFATDDILDNVEPTKELITQLFNGKQFRQHLFHKYIYDLKDDNSHITFKLKQAINYFEFNIFNSIDIENSSLHAKEKDLNLNVSIKKEYFKNREKIEDIPLAVFNHVLQVVKIDEKNESKRNELVENKKLIPFSYISLSSGEQHMMNSVLTVAYHIYNLLSVNEGYELKKYKNINLIFDELELYLHPEYQRRYINDLINILNEISKVTKQTDINYNILMVTHSPFILSDIPSQNILKLEDGKPREQDNINSFAANIYDLLKDEFFLKEGAIGSYAQTYITDLIKNLEKLKPDDSKELIDNLKKKIGIIGEELIRYKLEDLLLENTQNFSEEIIILEQRIKKLKSKAR
ncbi:AAA family ATPase [Pedobacter sp. GR22-10]|uniref:AAA family ATPase n=1 Tax=Pedobacter sp. GR22-10 TaxID=2994472 RepID=UPI002245A783|nr:AAA family ATPase [Pedobacter sp. GR22-10]MCX2430888.1 AAA family ATPase [Pedobacter sp. GR22-10]